MVTITETFSYVVTTIDVIETGDATSLYGSGARHIYFSGKIKAKDNDKSVAYLLDVKQDQERKDEVVFKGVSVPLATFREKILAENKKLLACVHGFQTEPDQWLLDCSTIQSSADFDHMVVPVIWPSVGIADGLIDTDSKYDTEQDITLQAGKALATIAEEIGKESHLSLMCHSMGNRVLFSYVQHNASIHKKFKNVFMVAADVWQEVFNTRIIEDWWWQPPWNYWNEWKDTGLKLCRMMNDGGKIHIACYEDDWALFASEYWENWRRRLGRYGKAGQGNRIHKDCKDKLKDFNARKDEVEEADNKNYHNYHTMPRLIKYYGTVMNGN